MSDLVSLLGSVTGYDDLRAEVTTLVRSGALAPHARLPPVRGARRRPLTRPYLAPIPRYGPG